MALGRGHHRGDGPRYIVQSDEMLTAFLELEKYAVTLMVKDFCLLHLEVESRVLSAIVLQPSTPPVSVISACLKNPFCATFGN